MGLRAQDSRDRMCGLEERSAMGRSKARLIHYAKARDTTRCERADSRSAAFWEGRKRENFGMRGRLILPVASYGFRDR